MIKSELVIGNSYRWQFQKEELVYLGEKYSGNGYWHQFAKKENTDIIWCEILDGELKLIIEYKPTIENELEFERSIDNIPHNIGSHHILTELETGRVVAVFYNDYDLDIVISMLRKYENMKKAISEIKKLEFTPRMISGVFDILNKLED